MVRKISAAEAPEGWNSRYKPGEVNLRMDQSIGLM